MIERLGWKIAKARIEDHKAGRTLVKVAIVAGELLDENHDFYLGSDIDFPWNWTRFISDLKKEVKEQLYQMVTLENEEA